MAVYPRKGCGLISLSKRCILDVFRALPGVEHSLDGSEEMKPAARQSREAHSEMNSSATLFLWSGWVNHTSHCLVIHLSSAWKMLPYPLCYR